MNIASFFTFTTKVERAYSRLAQPVLEEFELSKTSFDIVMFLANNPECYTAKEISVIKNIKPNVVSLHVDKLVNEGYLRREAVVGDRRKIRLVCTEKTKPVVEKGHEVQKKFFDRLVKGLTQEDIDGFRHCFQVFAENAECFEEELNGILNGGGKK